MFFHQIFEDKLAQYAYLIGCQATGEAIVIDPMRDIARYEGLAEENGLKIVAAADTHIHADYLTGLREFAEKGVRVFASDEGGEDWRYEWLLNSNYDYTLLRDGDTFNIGNIHFKAVHSPGHTPEHMSYLVTDGATTDQPMGILSGDFVFVGDVGRPDLLETAAGQEGVMESSARTMYESLQIFDQLPEYLQLWPGHGAGSACGKALGAVPESTVGYEKRFNQSIRSAITEDDFVEFILSGQPEPPLYFARMKRDNKKGPAVLGTLPQPEHMSVPSIIGQVRISNAVILDSRNRDQFMEAHIQGSLLSPLNKQFNTVAGCYIDDDQDIYLIVEEDRLEEAVTDLIRIGLDKVVAYATPDDLKKFSDEGGELFSTDTINFEQVDELLSKGEARLLDVRKASEVEEGGHPEAVNIAHTRLKDRITEIPTDKTLLISCRSGARSAVASAFLESREFVVKYVDDLVEPWLKKHGWDQVSA